MVRVLSAKMEVLYNFADKSEDQVLLSYAAYKGWRTRNVEKVTQLIPLQNNAYSMTTEKEMQRCLANVEKYTDILSQQAQWLRSEGHEHIRECSNMGCSHQSIDSPSANLNSWTSAGSSGSHGRSSGSYYNG